MNTEQKAREWVAFPSTVNDGRYIIIALLAERQALLDAANKTIADNLHLADGDDCTLYDLKQAIAMCEESNNGN